MEKIALKPPVMAMPARCEPHQQPSVEPGPHTHPRVKPGPHIDPRVKPGPHTHPRVKPGPEVARVRFLAATGSCLTQHFPSDATLKEVSCSHPLVNLHQ